MIFDQRAAREFVALFEGTRHMQRRRQPGRGVDCIQLTLGTLEAASMIPPVTLPTYSQRVGFARDQNSIGGAFLAHFFCHRIPISEWEPRDGDVGVFRAGRYSNHVGIVVDGRFWHVTTEAPVHHTSIAAIRGSLQEAIRFTRPGFRRDPATIQLTK